MSFRQLLFISLAFTSSLSLNLCAQTLNQSQQIDDIEVIEVVNGQNFTSPNYQILHREDFVNSSQTLSDLLQAVNGIQIRQISGLGNPTSISIRGSTGKQVQFYIDGQLVNDSQFGGFDLNQIPTEQIESIEISKNQAIGTGATPIGGVIRINTYNPLEDTTKITLAAGSFDYQEINIIQNNAFKNHSFSFGGNYVTSKNNYDYLVPQSFNDSSTSINEPLKNNEFKKHTLFINENAQFGQHQIRVNIQYNNQEKSLPNYQNNSPENGSKLESDNIRYSYQHNWLSDSSWLDNIEFEFNYEDKDELYVNSPNESRRNTGEYHTIKKHLGFKPLFTWQTLKLTPFLNYNEQKFTSKSKRNGKPNQCNGISSCDIAAQQKQFNYGVRAEWRPNTLPISSYVLASKLDEDNNNIAINHDDAEKYQNNNDFLSYELGFNYKNGNFKTLVNYSKGIRTPTLYELFGDRGSFKGNDNLLPEEAENISISAQYHYQQFSFSSSIYHQELENSIVAIFNSSNVGSYSNVNNAKLLGFEFQGTYQVMKGLSIILQSNLIDSETHSKFSAFDQKKLPGIYHQQYSSAIDYQISDAWKINLKTSIDKELYFNLSNKFENKNNKLGNGNPADRITSDLSINWQTQKHKLALNINNLFNDNYQDLANRPAQGRSIQLKYTLEGI